MNYKTIVEGIEKGLTDFQKKLRPMATLFLAAHLGEIVIKQEMTCQGVQRAIDRVNNGNTEELTLIATEPLISDAPASEKVRGALAVIHSAFMYCQNPSESNEYVFKRLMESGIQLLHQEGFSITAEEIVFEVLTYLYSTTHC